MLLAASFCVRGERGTQGGGEEGVEKQAQIEALLLYDHKRVHPKKGRSEILKKIPFFLVIHLLPFMKAEKREIFTDL